LGTKTLRSILLSDLDELTIAELIDEFDFLGEWEEQCRYLIELGEQLPDLDTAEKNEVNRVTGCQARVWLVPEVRHHQGEPQIHFRAKSDARLVDGLIVVLSLLYNGKRASEILATDIRQPLRKLGLETHLVPQRRNGLFAMVDRVRGVAEQSLGQNTASDAGPGRQGTVESPAPTQTPAAPSTAAAPVPRHAAASHTIDSAPASVATDADASSPSGTAGRAGGTANETRNVVAWNVDTFRAQFPALQQILSGGRRVVFLDSASSSQKPQVVIDKEREVYEQYYANAYRGVYRFGDRVSRELELAREKARSLVNAASSEEIIFTSGSTMGLNLIANGWGRKHLQPGDEILLSLLEHHANIVPWQWVAQQTGARVRFLPLTDSGQLDLATLDEYLTSRTRVVSVTGLSNVLGTAPPLAEIGQRARDVGALFVVDGAQSVPHAAMDVQQLGLDCLVFSGHKLYGPSGIGIAYGRREVLEAMDPFLCGGHMISEVTVEGFRTAPIPAKFEAGTLPIAQAIALGTAIDFVQSFGLEAIHAHEQQLLREAWARMSEVPGMKLFGPTSAERGAIIPFTLDGAAAQDVASLLDLHGVCVRHGHHCTMPLHDWLGVPATIRASFAGYNTREDVDMLLTALDDVRATLKLR
jgi:cysteine desulfurase / selenocysteine lyase